MLESIPITFGLEKSPYILYLRNLPALIHKDSAKRHRVGTMVLHMETGTVRFTVKAAQLRQGHSM